MEVMLMESSNWQTRLLFDWMTATDESDPYWRNLATNHDLDTAIGLIVEAVVAEVESLPSGWARDVAMKSAQSVQWRELTEALRAGGRQH
ncbi:hypothetical protein [Spiribacter roseus]|uniref:Uncharacterized protein n=1 Tax=Spiribacter roseus TaxID=1855875 RepID=A0ABV3RWF0_9GAMM